MRRSRLLNFQNGARRTGTHGHTAHTQHTPHTPHTPHTTIHNPNNFSGGKGAIGGAGTRLVDVRNQFKKIVFDLLPLEHRFVRRLALSPNFASAPTDASLLLMVLYCNR